MRIDAFMDALNYLCTFYSNSNSHAKIRQVSHFTFKNGNGMRLCDRLCNFESNF